MKFFFIYLIFVSVSVMSYPIRNNNTEKKSGKYMYTNHTKNTKRKNSMNTKNAGYVVNIEKETMKNTDFRKVLFTDERLQLVLMDLKPSEEIGMEVHDGDQFLRIESGEGKAILNGVEHKISDGSVIIVPAGTHHNIINTASKPMKLYTLYSPPQHKPGTIHKTKADAMREEK